MGKLKVVEPDFLRAAEDALVEANNALQAEAERRKLLKRSAKDVQKMELLRLAVHETLMFVRKERG